MRWATATIMSSAELEHIEHAALGDSVHSPPKTISRSSRCNRATRLRWPRLNNRALTTSLPQGSNVFVGK
jgi:hypothetical protein